MSTLRVIPVALALAALATAQVPRNRPLQAGEQWVHQRRPVEQVKACILRVGVQQSLDPPDLADHPKNCPSRP